MKKAGLGVTGLLLSVLVVAATLVRFVSLSESPPGFYTDEAAISAQVICMRQSGTNLQGQYSPLFSEVLGGGYATPSYLYPAVAWTSLFGDSIKSFRSLAAFFSVLFILGSFFLGLRVWGGGEPAWLCALTAALSPWAFQFARIAWDPALAPAYMVWGFALLWVGDKKYRRLQLAASGVFFSLAAYCYPPLRIQLAIMIPLAILGLVLVYRRAWKPYLIPIATGFIVAIPLLEKTLSGEIQGRFQMLSVFNQAHLVQAYESSSGWGGAREVIANFFLLLSPNYLMFQGDANLRHSTGSFGIWSWLDTLGICAGLIVLILILFRRTKFKVAAFEICFVVAGYLSGLLPAALTWESNPHALRSFGAATFLVLGSGGGLHLLWRQAGWLRALVIGLACIWMFMFFQVYFYQYPKIAGPWFDEQVTATAKQLLVENSLPEMSEALKLRGIDYAPMAVAYYQLAGGALRCPMKKPPEIKPKNQLENQPKYQPETR